MGFDAPDSPEMTFHAGDAVGSTTNDTYTNILESSIEPNLIPADIFDDGVFTALLAGRLDNGFFTTVDVRLRNQSDSETVTELTGFDDSDGVVIGPEKYIPSDPANDSSFVVQLRNGDDSTEVQFRNVTVAFGHAVE